MALELISFRLCMKACYVNDLHVDSNSTVYVRTHVRHPHKNLCGSAFSRFDRSNVLVIYHFVKFWVTALGKAGVELLIYELRKKRKEFATRDGLTCQ
jgi:hypothetical protein